MDKGSAAIAAFFAACFCVGYLATRRTRLPRRLAAGIVWLFAAFLVWAGWECFVAIGKKPTQDIVLLFSGIMAWVFANAVARAGSNMWPDAAQENRRSD
jgi:RsiW-degrading membrane proteinase PrsW (M82 family)